VVDRAELLRQALEALDGVVAAQDQVEAQMRRTRTSIRRSRHFLEAGGRAIELREVANATEQREANNAALRGLAAARVEAQHTLYRLAAADGMTAADIARAWGVSRQLVSRVLNGPDRRATPVARADASAAH
jgi:DNA invertase Pin-like site-specific DNA recombinase